MEALTVLSFLNPAFAGGTLLFRLLGTLYEGTSVIIIANLSVSEWARVFGDNKMTTALLDRLIHYCHILETGDDCFRFKYSPARKPDNERKKGELVLHAYDKRCAITGLKLINGGGRAEVDAAHIRPVEASGPDSLSNGIALSGTAHWMFGRGLIGLSDDLDILISRQANDPDSIRGLLNKTGKAIVPGRAFERPHPRFLKWHRETCFKL